MKNNEEMIEEYKKFRETNNKAKNTILADINAMNQLRKYTKGKNFDKIDEKDTIGFIGSFTGIGTKVQYATRLIRFYRWLNKLDKRERPANMKWFEYPSKDQIIKRKDPDVKKYLITDDEYAKIIQFCGDEGKWAALFETLYLSGGRPDEVTALGTGQGRSARNRSFTGPRCRGTSGTRQARMSAPPCGGAALCPTGQIAMPWPAPAQGPYRPPPRSR